MVSNNYLKNRNGHFYLRYRIPSDLSPLLPQAEIVKSLKTTNLKTAKVSVLPYLQAITQTFSLFRSGFITTEQATGRLTDPIERKPMVSPTEAATAPQKACMEPVGVIPRGTLLSAFIQTYTRDKGQQWTAKSKMEMKGIFRLLVDLMGIACPQCPICHNVLSVGNPPGCFSLSLNT